MRYLATLAVLASCALPVAAQKSSTPGHAGVSRVRPHSGNFAPRRRDGSRHGGSPLLSPYSSLPFPFFGDAFNPDDIYSSGYPVASQAPPFLMEALRNLAAPNAGGKGTGGIVDDQILDNRILGESGPSNSQPLMIELQNGRYVRVKSVAVDGEAQALAPASFSGAQPARRRNAKPSAPPSAQPLIAAATPAPLPAAVLVFRDGHSEEVRDYTIADGFLYARGDYYSDGYWNKKIDLGGLNVPGTLEANAARSVKFVLPSSPNEVITRP
jgi:hypothetical protein